MDSHDPRTLSSREHYQKVAVARWRPRDLTEQELDALLRRLHLAHMRRVYTEVVRKAEVPPGKPSLAFDVLYAEGQRRYTFSAVGAFVGFVDGAVSGAVFAWLYNKLARV